MIHSDLTLFIFVVPLSRSEIDEYKTGHPFSATRIRDPVKVT